MENFTGLKSFKNRTKLSHVYTCCGTMLFLFYCMTVLNLRTCMVKSCACICYRMLFLK